MIKELGSDARYRAVLAVWNKCIATRGVQAPKFDYMMRELEKACLRTADWNRIADFPFFIQRIEGDLKRLKKEIRMLRS